MAKNSVKTGGILAGAGCIFGLAPIIVSFIAMFAFGSDLGFLHWYVFYTAPVGAAVVIVGLIITIVGANMSTASDFAGSTKSVELPPLPSGLARLVKIAYAVGFGIVLVSCVMRVVPMFWGLLTLLELIPVFFAGWIVFLARNAHDGLGFLRLYQTQLLVSIAGCVTVLWPFGNTLSGLAYDGSISSASFELILITGQIPQIMSIASLVFAGIVRARYRRGLKAS
jgi:hypothetical protein